jgi:predicted secreted Zn-dependent protease
MKPGLSILAAIACLAAAPAHAERRAAERVEPYAISGSTGIELYRSIGANGPKVAGGRVIALTDFTLTWQRDYRPTGDGGCTLAAAVPKLTLIYRLPEPKGTPPPETRRLWRDFIAGVTAHERVHGEMIVDMVRKLEAASIGLTVANDPDCRKIRQALVEPFRRISNERVEKSRAFDREEMSDGGNVHGLILRLVNGE